MLVTDQLRRPDGFTPTEQRINTYLLAHLNATPTLTIQGLATATYTSHSAVVRLAKKLGFTGFRALRAQLTVEVHRLETTPVQVNANFPFTPGDSTMTIAKKMADLTTAAVNRTIAQLDEPTLSQAASMLEHANHIYCFAVGDSQIRARSFQNKLVKVGRLAVIAEEYGDESWTAANIKPTDCAVFISYGGDKADHLRLLQLLAQQHVPTLVITGNAASPQIDLATCAIVTTQPEHDDVLKVGTFASQVAFEYVLDTLFSIMYARSYQQNLVQLKRNYNELDERKLLDNQSKHN